MKPHFLITVDAEGDNLWENPVSISTRNADYVGRFQNLSEANGFKTTWLTNYEMARCPGFVEFAADLLLRGSGEVGMHLHAWDSPPVDPLDGEGQTYLIEYPETVMRSKVDYMTKLLEDTFGRRPTSHRAGRWAFDSRYARILNEAGYQVDTSVTPGVSWRHTAGAIGGAGGTDYRDYPGHPYFLDLDDVSGPGRSVLLEVPVSIVRSGKMSTWLRPDGSNVEGMLHILDLCLRREWKCVVFMLHSSELMPGGSPNFPTQSDIDKLYSDLAILFESAAGDFRGATLGEFYEHCVNQARHGFATE